MGADAVVGVNAYAVGAFVGYLALIVGIGVYAARFSSKGISEFFVAGRRLGPFVVALSAVASGRSAWLLLGLSGTAYTMGRYGVLPEDECLPLLRAPTQPVSSTNAIVRNPTRMTMSARSSDMIVA